MLVLQLTLGRHTDFLLANLVVFPGTCLKGYRSHPRRRASLHDPREPTDPPEPPSQRPARRLLPPWSSLSCRVSSARPAAPCGPDVAGECPTRLAPRRDNTQ